ncbi:MAG: tripartite tricarboxylate transporter substrate binding protein [Betaproteobacteria bacterium]
MRKTTELQRSPARRALLTAALAASVTPPASFAQTTLQSDKPLRIVVPFAPGAGTDAVARLIAPALAQSLNRPVVVENRAGASGAIGSRLVAQSPPDGLTILLVASPFTTVAAVNSRAGYDPVADFAPIGLIASGPLLWAGSVQSEARSLDDWIRRARERPGTVLYGSAGAGGINHLMLELLNAQTGAQIVHVPYRGTAPAVVDLVGGQIHLLTGTIPALLPHLREGRIRALAVSTSARTPSLPDVPGMRESGFDTLDVRNVFGFAAPAKTPANIIAQIASALDEAIRQPAIRDRLTADALDIVAPNPASMARFIVDDSRRWQDLATRHGIRVDEGG